MGYAEEQARLAQSQIAKLAQPQYSAKEEETIEEPIEVKRSALTPEQRGEISGLPTAEGKIAYLEKVAGFKPENISTLNGKLGVYDEKNPNLFYPIDEKGLSMGDITELKQKGIVSLAQVGGGSLGILAGGGLASVATGAAGAGAAGALAEHVMQHATIADIKKKYGVDLGKHYSGKEVLLEGALGAGGELLSAVGGVGIRALKGRATTQAVKKLAGEFGETATKKAVKAYGDDVVRALAKSKNKEAVEQALNMAGKKQGKLLAKDILDTNATKALSKIVPQGENTLTNAKLLAGQMEDSTFTEVATNPYVQKHLHAGISNKVDDLANEAGTATVKLLDNLDGVKGKFYKKAGITDKTKVNVRKAIVDMQSSLAKQAELAKGSPLIAKDLKLNKAKQTLKELIKNSKKGSISFGKIKRYQNFLYETGEKLSDKGNKTAGKLFKEMSHSLKVAKDQMPEMAKAGKEFRTVANAMDEINNLFRLNTAMGELNIENKIINMYKDKGMVGKKEILKRVRDVLKTMPETAKYADFYDKIALTHVAQDIATKKAVTPVGLGRIPVLKYLSLIPGVGDPETKMLTLSGLAKRGMLNKEAINAPTKVGNIPFLSPMISRLKARSQVYNVPKMLGGIPSVKPIAKLTAPLIKKTAPLIKPLARQTLLREGTEKIFGNDKISISDLIRTRQRAKLKEKAPVYEEVPKG